MDTMIISGRIKKKNKDTGELDGKESPKYSYKEMLSQVYGASAKKGFQSDPIGVNLKSAKIYQETGKIVDPSDFIFKGKKGFTEKEKKSFRKLKGERDKKAAEEWDTFNKNYEDFTLAMLDSTSNLLMDIKLQDLFLGPDPANKYMKYEDPLRWKLYSGITSFTRSIGMVQTLQIAQADDKVRETLTAAGGMVTSSAVTFGLKKLITKMGIDVAAPGVGPLLLFADLASGIAGGEFTGRLYDNAVKERKQIKEKKSSGKKTKKKQNKNVVIPSIEDLISVNNNSMIIGFLSSKGINTYKQSKNNPLWIFQNKNKKINKKTSMDNRQYKRSTPKQKKTSDSSKNRKKQYDRAAKYAHGAMALMGLTLPFLRFANGGLVDSTTYGMVGEDGPEMIIPLSGQRRQRGLELWNQAGDMLGVPKYAEGAIKGTKGSSALPNPKSSPVKSPGGKRKNARGKNSGAGKISVGNIAIELEGVAGTDILKTLQEQKGQIAHEVKNILSEAMRNTSRTVSAVH